MKPNANGRINLAYEKPKPMTARRWNTYSWTILTEHFAALQTGGADTNPFSDKPQRRKEIKRAIIVRHTTRLFRDRKRVETELQAEVDASKPSRETWPLCNATGALVMGCSESTYKRRLSHCFVVKKVPQALKLGKPVHVSKLDAVMAPFIKRYQQGLISHVPRLQPVGNNMFVPQWDRPNKYFYRKGYHNWVIVHVPKDLEVGDGPYLRKLDGTEGTKQVVKTTVHRAPLQPGEVIPAVKVLKSNVVTLEHLPSDLQDPALWKELEEAGLEVFHSDYKKKVRVATRGSHRNAEKRKKGSSLRNIRDLNAKERNRVNPHTRKRRVEDQARRERAKQREETKPWNMYERLAFHGLHDS